MNILVTNDDGDSEGLRILLSAAKKFGDAYAVCPNRQRSAVSGALTLHKPLRLHKHGGDVYTLNGTPSDCVLFGIYSGEFRKPDMVLSGINWGDNSGIGSILGSGTLGACWQAAIEYIPSIAFSITRGSGDWHLRESWGDSEKIREKVEGVINLLKPKLDKNRFFSVNMPYKLDSAKTVMVKRLQRERYLTKIERRHDPDGRPYYWVSGLAHEVEEGTDVHEVMVNRNIAITEISLDLFEKIR